MDSVDQVALMIVLFILGILGSGFACAAVSLLRETVDSWKKARKDKVN